jgi:hypothetical protein
VVRLLILKQPVPRTKENFLSTDLLLFRWVAFGVKFSLHSIILRYLESKLHSTPRSPSSTTQQLNTMVKAVVAGASGGIGQVKPKSSVCEAFVDNFQAIVSPPQVLQVH